MSKYLQQLPDDVLQSPEIRFALDIWSSLKTENYARFFYLLRKKATILQACLMHRYVGEVRLSAIRKVVRTFCVPNTRGPPCTDMRLDVVMRWFLFESVSDAVEFLSHCGLEYRIHAEDQNGQQVGSVCSMCLEYDTF